MTDVAALARGTALQAQLDHAPRRCRDNIVIGEMGDCACCDAANGEVCKIKAKHAALLNLQEETPR